MQLRRWRNTVRARSDRDGTSLEIVRSLASSPHSSPDSGEAFAAEQRGRGMFAPEEISGRRNAVQGAAGASGVVFFSGTLNPI